MHHRAPPICHSEERSDVGISCRQFRFRRECLVIRPSAAEIAPQGHFLALRAQGATAPLGPRNDKSGSIAPLNSCHQYCQPAWRSLSAATDAIGAYHFIGSHYESAASRREGHAPPLQRIPGGFAKLSPFHFQFSIFPRPSAPHYIIKRTGLRVRSFSISFSPGYRRCTCARRSPSTRHRYRNTGRSYCP